jgi:hypothetical protein
LFSVWSHGLFKNELMGFARALIRLRFSDL